MKRLSILLLSGTALLLMSQAGAQNAAPEPALRPLIKGASQEWPSHHYDTEGTRYSPLTQITPANVSKLKLAWTFHMKPENFVPAPGRGGQAAPAAPGAARGAAPAAAPPANSGNGARNQSRFSESEVTPIVVDGMMYVTTPYRRVVALNSSTGKEIWSWNGSGSTRGVEYWPGDRNTPPQIIFHGAGGLVSLDAKTGTPNAKFGNNGVLAPPPVATGGGGGGGGSSPPILWKNIVVSGSANPYNDGRSSGDIRGFDIATGKQLWRFNTIPVKGEPGYDTWAPNTAERNNGVHIWGLMTLDSKRGIVYAPLNAPGWNRYGGDREGNNLYSSSIVALDVNTGKLLWHFQVVHHDIWDMDADAPSTLFDVKKDGKVIPAIGVVSKSALLFILDRVTGKPIYGVEERPVPQSEVPLEKTAKTQPFPIKPPPLGRQTMTLGDIANLTPEHTNGCLEMMKKWDVQVGGPYMPPGYKRPSVNFPGPNGSINWGGGSFNPKLGYYIVNSQDLGQLTMIGERGSVPYQFNGVTGGNAPNNDNIPYEMVGLNGRFKVLGLNMMCQRPPWGRLIAVNVNTGDIAWQVPLGITEQLPADKQHTGRPNSGGSILTASNLVFIGATDDARFRAFDARNGKELWTVKLPAGSHSVPATYMGKNGKQYVVFPSTGGDFIEDPGAADELQAYTLP